MNNELLVYQHCIPSHKTNVQYKNKKRLKIPKKSSEAVG